MGNLICLMALTRPGQEVICEEAGHTYYYEMAGMCAIAGVLPRVVAGQDGILSWDGIRRGIRPKVYYRPQTALISLENSHNMAGGTVYPTALVEEICDKAHEAGILVHMDGARIFNAATYLGEDVCRNDREVRFRSVLSQQGVGRASGISGCRLARFYRTLPKHSKNAGRRNAPGGDSRSSRACRAGRRTEKVRGWTTRTRIVSHEGWPPFRESRSMWRRSRPIS